MGDCCRNCVRKCMAFMAMLFCSFVLLLVQNVDVKAELRLGAEISVEGPTMIGCGQTVACNVRVKNTSMVERYMELYHWYYRETDNSETYPGIEFGTLLDSEGKKVTKTVHFSVDEEKIFTLTGVIPDTWGEKSEILVVAAGVSTEGSVYLGQGGYMAYLNNIDPTEDSMPLIQKLTQKITFRSSAIKKGKVIYGTSFSLNAKTTGTGKLSYKSSNPKVLSVNAKGKVTVKGYGPAYIQIKASGGDGYKAVVRKFKLTAVPEKGKVTDAKQENGTVRFKWKPEKSADGYEYAVAYNHKFSGQNRKKTKKTGLVLTKYKTGTKKMFLKVRAYKKIGKKVYYGSWSRAKCVKLKKGRKAGQMSYSIVG